MKKTIIIALAAAALVSCAKEKLNPFPSNAVLDEQIFSSVETAKNALNSGMAYVAHYYNLTLDTISSELMGEDATLTSGAYGLPTYSWLEYAYTYSQTPSESPWQFGYANYIWPNAYKAIDVANNIIAHFEDAPEQPGLENLLGQAHALRGYFFLRLVRLFAPAYSLDADAAGIILRTTPAGLESEHLGRASVKNVYTQIINDLDYGRQNCSDADTKYFTPKACALLMARAYLDMNDYAKAKAKAEEAADNVFDGSNLMSQAEYQAGFHTANDEWLMYAASEESTSNYYASVPSFYYLAKSAVSADENGQASIDDLDYLETEEEEDFFGEPLYGYSTVRWTARFRNSFDDDDCRKLFPFYFDEADGWLTSKFSHRGGSLGVADFPIARIAEAYLIKAECELQLGGNTAAAQEVLNALQEARGAGTTEATEATIYQERRKELYGEGFVLADMKRLHLSLDRTQDPEHWSTLTTLPADSPRFMFPMPEVELLYNKALTKNDQNAYWKK